MKELEEVSCEIHSIINIQHCISNYLNNAEGEYIASLNGSQMYYSSENIRGGFLNDAVYAWLSYDSHLVVLNVKTGQSISSWTFREKITCISQFPAQCGELPLLLVGLDNEASRIKDSSGSLCIFDCTSSCVLRAIKMPAGVEQVCIISGGAEWEEFNDKRSDNILMQMDGIACVVLRNLYHLMIDLQRSTWEIADLTVIMDETSPAEIEFLTTKDSFHKVNGTHMACNLLSRRVENHIGFNREAFELNGFLDEKLTNTIISSTKIGCIISGCLGRIIIWQNDGSVGWISQPVDESMIVTHLALLEPTDDPRSFYYLWVVFHDDSFKVPPVLRMYALLFEQKYCDRGTNLYFNLEAEPCLKFEFELDSKDKVISLSTIERETNSDQTESESKKGEDSLLLISTTTKTLLFDLNQWYKEQMPQTVSDCKNPNSILACYNMKHRPSNATGRDIVSGTYIPRTLQEFPNNHLSSLEELFFPNSLSLEWIELSPSKLINWLSRGIQAELLREMALAGPIMLTQPTEMFHKCLSVGLVPFNVDVAFSSDHNVQRDMLLSLCLEQRWATFLIRCANEWSDGSAAYMYPSFLKWGIQRASNIKIIADRLCVSLFDQSGNNIGESEVKLLRFCHQQLECLSSVVAKLPFEGSTLTKQRKALKRVSMYFQVLLWFYDVGLLPESQNLEEGSLPISLALKIPYPFEKLLCHYEKRRESMKNDKLGNDKEMLFIDELISRECPALNSQWEKESGDFNTNGHYPPPSLQSLLRSYLTDCDHTDTNDIECKHQITIYLLMDLAMLLQGSYPGVDQLIKYPSSFKMSPSLIKLTQAFWLLDHNDYHGFLDMITGQLVSDSDVKDWHHNLVLKTLVNNSRHKLALTYLKIKKPPLSSIQEQSTLIDLSVEHGLVQSAFHRRPQSHYAQLLICFFQACKNYGKLGEILHLALDLEEEDMFIKFLEDSKSEDIRRLYYLQRCRYIEANYANCTSSLNSVCSKEVHADMLKAYNATLPEVVKRFSENVGKSNLDFGLEARYPRPMTYCRGPQRSTSIYETVIMKARETCPAGEKTMIPFISAPCTFLKPSDNRFNISCVISPKVLQRNRKRTMDQVMHDEENRGMQTPERAKRRKIVDDGEAVLSAAFSTPLVKRKKSNNVDITMETPHSILKIRQLIRKSASSNVGSLQEDIMDTPLLDKERKINRQIRFNIGQLKRSSSHDNVNGEEEFPKINTSEESEEAFFSPSVSEKSIMESPILSDNSYTCKNIYTARPRPSLRRCSLQASTKITSESLANHSGTRNSEDSRLSSSSINTQDNCFRISKKNTQQESRECTSILSTSIHSSAILSPDSSFEINPIMKTSDESHVQFSLKFSKQQDSRSNCVTSMTSLVKNSVSMDIENKREKDTYSEVLHIEKQGESMHKMNYFKGTGMDSSYRNGNLLKSNTSENTKTILVDKNEEFESVSNETENNFNYMENEHGCWSLQGKALDELDRREEAGLKNGEHFDITDDESSNNEDEIVLALNESETKEKAVLKTPPMQINSIFDAPNITDDESDSSIEVERAVSNQQSDEYRSTFSTRKKAVIKKHKTEADSIQVHNNKSSSRRTMENAISESGEHKDAVNISNFDSESSAGAGSVTPRMTRSRRATSIAKEISTLPINSSSKVSVKASRSRRSSSLVKDVLTASINVANERIKKSASSGSEESSGASSSPRRIRGKRASSIVKDISMETEVEQPKTPVRRSTRRSASVQKELLEPVKYLTKNSEALSISSIMEKEEAIQTVAKGSKTKQSITGGRKPNVKSNKSLKETKPSELDEERVDNIKRTRRRSSSVPKEMISTPKLRRSSSIAKEIISEELETPVETTKGQYVMEQIVNSPAANTRSRKSSIQSIPEELEEILSMPAKERATNKKQHIEQNSRHRRAMSVELSQVKTRRTRNTHSKGIFEEIIMEEDVTEAEHPEEEELKGKKVLMKRKRVTSETSVQEIPGAPIKGRKGKKPTKQENHQFSFSQPENADDAPLDQKG